MSFFDSFNFSTSGLTWIIGLGPATPEFPAFCEHLLKKLPGTAFGDAPGRFAPYEDNFARISSKGSVEEAKPSERNQAPFTRTTVEEVY